MFLPEVFVGFSGNDLKYFKHMIRWKEKGEFNFNLRNCHLHSVEEKENREYIQSICKNRFLLGDKYLLLIGEDTKNCNYVTWEAEIAIKNKCTIIGVNLSGAKVMEERTCPEVIKGIGAVFIPFSPKIVKYAIENYKMNSAGNFFYREDIYKKLGY
ncbi:MAG: TIR domain-containing protein [Bacillota bacterium]